MAFKVGDKIKIKLGKEHEPEMKGATGTIRVISSPALGLKLDKMDDDETSGIHKWYVSSELKRLSKKATGSRLGM